ncbi:MAG: penicillin-binding protein 2 [Hyphomicrobium sp.]|uniref:penicillin-binding protein 2 n=1 Tax=Hyphomicrobium sp. TaxID=82 RepID=UPI0039E71734
MADPDDDDWMTASPFTRRSLLLGGAQVAGFALIGWKLFDLQVVNAHRYAPQADDNRINIQPLAPKRGRILDTFGRVLADNDRLFRATITPALSGNASESLRRVSHIVALTDDDIARILARTRKQNRNLPTTIASDLSFEQVAKLNLYAPSLPGIKTDFVWRRRYHDGTALSHAVGVVGSVERFGIADDAVTRIPDIRLGKSGAELAFDSDLRGAAGTQKSEVDARGRTVRTLETIDPVPGRDVMLSIDAELQRRVVERMGSERRAAAVVLDIASGNIEVLASVPGYDPAAVAGGISDVDWKTLSELEDNPLLNRAVAGLYAPGSTFLVVTALAALKAGVVTVDEHITCNGKYELGGQVYRCSKPSGHGNVTVEEAIRSSCEVFFCEMSTRLGISRIASAARAMGMGAASNCGLMEEKPGIVPDPDWKRGNLNAGWVGGETVLTGIGQGYMQATPLQLAIVAARLASGRTVAPVLRKTDQSTAIDPTTFAELAFNASHIETVRKAMREAVNDADGSARAAASGDGKPLIAGKSGVSEIGGRAAARAGEMVDWAKRNHSVFVGYESVATPRYAIASVIEHGGGPDAAAILARDIFRLIGGRESLEHGKSGADGEGLRQLDALHGAG